MAHLKAFIHILTTNNIYNGHIYVRKCHLEPRKKLIFLPQYQPWYGHVTRDIDFPHESTQNKLNDHM